MSAAWKSVGKFLVDLRRQTIWYDRGVVEVTPKAAAIFAFLIENAGNLVTHQQLLEAVWPATSIQPEALKVYIFELRRALGDEAKKPTYIETVPRRGYRLIAPVSDAASDRPVPAAKAGTGILDRDDQIAELFAGLHDATRGSRRLIFISGEAGIGKSALMQEFLERARTLARIHIAQGQALDLHSPREPYYPVLEALPRLDIPGLQRALMTHAPAWLARLPSMWPDESWSQVGAEWMSVSAERMLREICELLEAIAAEETVVLVLEDLQWADNATIDFLSACARRKEKADLLLIGSFRSGYGTHARSPVAALSAELGIKQLCRNIALGALPRATVRQLLVRSLGDEEAAARMLDEVVSYTGGNPLYIGAVEEQLRGKTVAGADRSLAEPGSYRFDLPLSVRDLALAAFETLSPAQQRLLEYAALVGRRFSAWALSVAAGIREEEVEEACESLAGEPGILRSAGSEELPEGRQSQRFEFLHGLDRDAIAGRVEPAKRLRAQTLLAQAIEQEYAGSKSELAPQLAWRFEQAHAWGKAIEYLRLAAGRARVPAEALALLARAKSHVPKLGGTAAKDLVLFELLLELAAAAMAAFDAGAAANAWSEVAGRATTPELRCRFAGALVSSAAGRLAFDYSLSFRMADWMAGLAPGLADPQLEKLAAFQQAFLSLVLKEWTPKAFNVCKQEFAGIRAGFSPCEAAPWTARYAYLLALTSDAPAARRIAADGLRSARRCGDPFAAFLGAHAMGLTLLALGRWDEFLHRNDSAIAWAEKGRGEILALLTRGQSALLWLECFEFQRVLDLFGSQPQPHGHRHQFAAQQAGACNTRALAGLGQYRRALESAAREQAEAGGLMPLPFRIMLQHAIVESHLGLGNNGVAADEARKLIEMVQPAADWTSQALGWTLLSRCHQAAGAIGTAQDDINRAIGLIHDHNLPRAAWRVLAQASRCCFAVRATAEGQRYREDAIREVTGLAGAIRREPQLGRSFLAGARKEVETPSAMSAGFRRAE